MIPQHNPTVNSPSQKVLVFVFISDPPSRCCSRFRCKPFVFFLFSLGAKRSRLCAAQDSSMNTSKGRAICAACDVGSGLPGVQFRTFRFLSICNKRLILGSGILPRRALKQKHTRLGRSGQGGNRMTEAPVSLSIGEHSSHRWKVELPVGIAGFAARGIRATDSGLKTASKVPETEGCKLQIPNK
jgi:hypothetical protein